MKIKLVVLILLGAITTIFIYNATTNNKLRLLALGDGLSSGMTAYNVTGYSFNDYIKDEFKENNQLHNYNNSFTKKNLPTRELIEMIKDNVSKNINGEDITIQQAISNANIITLAIGMDEIATHVLNNTLTKKVINNYYLEIKELISLLKKYNHKKIIFLGIYQVYDLENFAEINRELKKIVLNNGCEFIDIAKLVQNEEYYFNETSYYLNYKGHKTISRAILKVI